jgi:hypothetical protein
MVAGVAALVLSVLGAFLAADRFFQSYLFAYLFWISIALGCLAILMLNYVTTSDWGLVTRRLTEAAALTLPLMALLFVPLLFGLPSLYEWTHAEVVGGDPILQQKEWYLNVPFFLVRAGIYFIVWIGLIYFLNRWSREQDRRNEPFLSRRLWLFSRYGLVLYVLTATFSAFDWGMSLEPHWYSTIYGIIYIASQGLAGLAFATILVLLLADYWPLSEIITRRTYNDLGNLLLAFVTMWAYVAFSQLLIIWYANLPEEVSWYVRRIQGGWLWLGLALVIFHFALPFVLLLSSRLKRSRPGLLIVAGVILVMRLVDFFWLVMPAFHETGLAFHWLDLITLVGIGGVWLAVFAWQLRKRPLLPLYDPHVVEAVSPP